MSKIRVDWVPVSERLPAVGKDVWTLHNRGSVCVAALSDSDYWFTIRQALFDITHWAEIEWPDPPRPVSQSFEGRIAGIGGTMRYLEIRNAEHQIRIHELPVTGFRTSMQVRVTVEEIVTDES